MSAFARYEGKEYDEAVAAAKRYVTINPASQDAPYAQYIIASSYFEQIPDISRDQTAPTRPLPRSTKSCANIPTPNMR